MPIPAETWKPLKNLIEFPTRDDSPLVELATALYTIAGQKPLPTQIPEFPRASTKLMQALYSGEKRIPCINHLTNLSIEEPLVKTDLVVVGTSGGKDSLSVVLQIKEMGLTPVMAFVKGINPSYPQERQAALDQANFLKCSFVEIESKPSRIPYIENPAKNQTILLLLADVAREYDACGVAMGTHPTETGETTPFEAGWSDCLEMVEGGKNLLNGVMPWLEYMTDFPHTQTSGTALKYIVDTRPDILPLVSSCMLPLRYKKNVRAANEKKLGRDLLAGRCGSCYKCCSEWLNLVRWGKTEPNKNYEKHVKERLLSQSHLFGPAAKNWSNERIIDEFLH